MRLTPLAPEIPEEGFTEDNDIFGYREFGERLANLIRNVQGSLVIALDGPWGSGKSVFVRQWAGLLRKKGAGVVLFDAFGNDHFEDAFLALSGQILATAKEELADEEPIQQFLVRAKRAGTALVPMLSRVAIRLSTAGVLSSEDFKDSGKFLKAIEQTTDIVEDAVAERLRMAKEERHALEEFRITLSELARKLGGDDGGESSFPLVFIIDELDRCRPPFALSIIERVKHLFSVPGVCFVFVTSMKQLEGAVAGTYGSATDARTYLQKFYNVRVVVPESQLREGQQARYILYLFDKLGIKFTDQLVHRGPSDRERLQALAVAHNLSLRALERIATNLVLARASVNPQDGLFSSDIMIDLCVLRELYPEIYQKAQKNSLRWKDVQDCLWVDAGDDKDYSKNWEKIDDLYSSPHNQGLDILRHMTDLIDALATRERES